MIGDLLERRYMNHTSCFKRGSMMILVVPRSVIKYWSLLRDSILESALHEEADSSCKPELWWITSQNEVIAIGKFVLTISNHQKPQWRLRRFNCIHQRKQLMEIERERKRFDKKWHRQHNNYSCATFSIRFLKRQKESWMECRSLLVYDTGWLKVYYDHTWEMKEREKRIRLSNSTNNGRLILHTDNELREPNLHRAEMANPESCFNSIMNRKQSLECTKRIQLRKRNRWSIKHK